MIGTALIRACVKNNDEILAIVRNGTNRINRLPKIDRICIEYADLDQLSSVHGDGKPYDIFYHFAWGHTSKEQRDNPVVQEQNIKATLQAVELAKKLGCKKFIGAGSQAEYGPVDGVISADTPAVPVTAYGIAKLSANLLSKRMCEQAGILFIWGRIFSVYGCNDNEGTMLDYAIRQFNRKETAIFSSGTQMWNYLNEQDAGKMFQLLGYKKIEKGTYCIANEESRPLREYIAELRMAYGEFTQCEFAQEDPKKSPMGLQVDMRKTIQAIQYHPQISFKDGIFQMINNRKRKYNEENKCIDSYL